MNGGDRILVAVGVVCAAALVVLGYENGHWAFGLMMGALAFSTVWVSPWLWLRFIAYGFTIAPADPEEVAAFQSSARIVLRIGILVWLASIAYLSMPNEWNRYTPGWILAAAQIWTPAIAIWLGYRSKATRKMGAE